MLRVPKMYTYVSRWRNKTTIDQVRLLANAFNARPAINNRDSMETSQVSSMQALNKRMTELQNTVSKTGRLTEKDLNGFFKTFEVEGKPTNYQILSLFLYCGELATAEQPSVKINNVRQIWKYIKNSGIKRDVSHYNALLKVYVENEHKFSPKKILAEMGKDNVTPNRLTYLHLMTAYCQNGDLEGTSELLEEMNNKNISLNENIFHALILGHCVAKDIGGAESVIRVMEEKNLNINSNTYATFLSGLALCGDIEKFDSVFKECTENAIKFRSDQLCNIIYYLAVGGQSSRALEMAKSNSDILSKNFPLLLNRLIHRKKFNECSEMIRHYREKNNYQFVEYENQICKGLAEVESFENIKKVALSWAEKGYGSDVLTKVLFYTLKAKLFDKSLKILNELHDIGKPVKELYFWPIFADLVNKKNATQILNMTAIMRNDFGIRVSKTLLSKLVFENLSVQPRTERFLLIGFNRIGLPKHFLTDAYIESCIRKRRTNALLQLTDFVNKKHIGNIMKCIAEDENVTDAAAVANLVQNLVVYAVNDKDVKPMGSPSDKELRDLPSENITKDINQTGQEVVDNCMVEIVSNLPENRQNFGREILKELVYRNLPISTATGEYIKKKWNDAETAAVIDELTQKEFNVASFTKKNQSPRTNENSNRDVLDELLKFCKKDMVDEAEKIIKDHPDLIDAAFTQFMMMLRKTNNEEKFTEYLKNYSKLLKDVSLGRNRFFLMTELIKKGFIKETSELIGKSRFDAVDKAILFGTLKPVFQNGSVEEVKMILEVTEMKPFAVRLYDVIAFYTQRKDWNKTLGMLEAFEYDRIKNLNLSGNIIPHLVHHGEMEWLNKLIELLEKKISLGIYSNHLLLAYACTGDVQKARKYLDSVETPNGMNVPNPFMILRDEDQRRITENLIDIFEGDGRFNIFALYECLMEMYERDKCDPSKGLELWERVQEINFVPSPLFLAYLGRLLKRNNVEIPFEDPRNHQWEWILDSKLPRSVQKRLFVPCSTGNLTKAEATLKENIKSGRLTVSMLRETQKAIMQADVDNEMSKIINNCLNFAEWKDALQSGQLYQRATRIANSDDPESILKIIPHSFLCDCLMNVTRAGTSTMVAQIFVWAHLRCNAKDENLSLIYDKAVEDFLQDRTVLERVLECAQYLKNKRILNFLISRRVFDEHDLTRRANYILSMDSMPGSSRNIRNRQSEKPSFVQQGNAEVTSGTLTDDQQGAATSSESTELKKSEGITRNTVVL